MQLASPANGALRRPLIGALVGMGPASTAPFYDAVMAHARAAFGAREDGDFPAMAMLSLPTPFTLSRPLDDGAMVSCLVAGVAQLERMAPSFIAVPCNSVHRYLTAMRAASVAPILDMVELSLASCAQLRARRVALLATPATVAGGLYQQGAGTQGLPLEANAELQPHLNQLIAQTKLHGRVSETLALYHEIMASLARRGYDAALVACTDLSAFVDAAVLDAAPLRAVDSTAVLAQHCTVAYYRLMSGAKK